MHKTIRTDKSRASFNFQQDLYTHCNLPWCSTHCWSFPSDRIWPFTLTGLVDFTLNLGIVLWWSTGWAEVPAVGTSSMNSSATSPSSSILRRFAYHLRPWWMEAWKFINIDQLPPVIDLTKKKGSELRNSIVGTTKYTCASKVTKANKYRKVRDIQEANKARRAKVQNTCLTFTIVITRTVQNNNLRCWKILKPGCLGSY